MPAAKKKPTNGHAPQSNGAPPYLLAMAHVLNEPESSKESPLQKRMRKYLDESLPKFMAMYEKAQADWERVRSEKRGKKRVDVGSDKCVRIIDDLLAEAQEVADGQDEHPERDVR